MKIQKKQAGFTLIELITVVSMLALLTIFIAREMGSSADDIKLQLVVTALVSSVPAAIIADKALQSGNCTNPMTAADLIERGVPTNTPWGEDWTATYNNGTRIVTVTYDLTGVRGLDDADSGGDALLTLLDESAVFNVKPTFVSPNIIATYSC